MTTWTHEIGGIKDSRYNVWVCEAKMLDGTWFPMPRWGAGDTRAQAMEATLCYCNLEVVRWAMNKDRTKLSRRIRFRNYGGIRK